MRKAGIVRKFIGRCTDYVEVSTMIDSRSAHKKSLF